MTEDKLVHAIFVGVNANNEDILPSSTESASNSEEDIVLVEQGYAS